MFVSRVFVIAHLSIFILAALKFLSDNSKINVKVSLMSFPNKLKFSWLFDCQVILVYILDILSITLWDAGCYLYLKENVDMYNKYSRLETIIFRRTCLYSWPLAGTCKLTFLNIPYTDMKHSLTDKGILLSTDYITSVLYGEHFLSFWDCGILVAAKHRVPMWPGPIKNFGYWISNGLPWAETLYIRGWILLLGGRVCSVGPLTEEESMGSLHMDSSPLCLCLLPYDLAVDPYYFAVITLTCEYDYMLSLVSPSNE